MFVLTTYKAYHNWQDGKEVVASFFSYEEAKKCLPNVMTSRTIVYNNFSEYLKMKDKVLKSQLISILPEIDHNAVVFVVKGFKGRSNDLETKALFVSHEEASKLADIEYGFVKQVKLSDKIYKSYKDYRINKPDFNF